MPIDNMFWSGPSNRDLHLLRGATGPDLSATALAFTAAGTDSFAAAYLLAHAGDVTLAFQPLFKGVLTGDQFEAFGIHVNTKTGQVRLDAVAPPAPIKNNFIVEVTATNSVGGLVFNEVIRVHIHTTVTRISLSPPTMTLRPGGAAPEQTACRFSVRAEFDDGTCGDVTLNHGVTWSPAANFNAAGQFIVTAANAVGSDVAATASFSSTAGTQTANGTVHIAQPWASEAGRPKLSIVPGGGWPGTIAPDKVPNILFLGDGFTAADQASFETVTNSFVHHIKLDPLVRPFDLLATSMNFWRTFMPATGNGISVRGEVFLHPADATKALPVPEAIKALPADDWVIENIVYAVGLPVPADVAKTPAMLRSEWQSTVLPDPTPKVANDDLITAWQKLATRAFIDELDRFPSLSYGEPPAANGHNPYGLNLHEDRSGVPALQSFYRPLVAESGVTLSDGTAVGLVWAQKNAAYTFDNTDLVVIVSSLPGGRAVNGNGYIAMSTVTQNLPLPVTAVGGRKGYTLGAVPLPADAAPDSCRTLAHELGHSFGLGDEYADFRLPYTTQDNPLNDFANLQTEKSAKGGGADFVGDEIKWNWPRIQKAAVIDGTITEAAGTFTIPLKLGQGFTFAQGDHVILRLRVAGKALGKNPDMLKPSEELEVSSPPTASSIMVRPVTAASVTLAALARFTPGSIVLLPTPAPASVKSAAYPYAEMVALNVKNAITEQKRPLTQYPCNNVIGPSVVAPDLTGIALPGTLCFKHKPQIVGLYENGARYTCAIYHPTGTCMMRQSHEEHAQFCAVCRYIMVDFVNPFRHFQIDLDYGEIYPLE